MSTNPWLPQGPTTLEPTAPASPGAPTATGPTTPQQSVPPPDTADQLGWSRVRVTHRVWVLGAHGGSGESTLAELLDGGETDHRWPSAAAAAPVVICARTHARGLRAAQLAAASWASGHTPPVKLLGLVLIADAPGRLPKPLAEFAERVAGGVPRIWRMPWVDDFRLGPPDPNASRPIRKLIEDIHRLVDAAN